MPEEWKAWVDRFNDTYKKAESFFNVLSNRLVTDQKYIQEKNQDYFITLGGLKTDMIDTPPDKWQETP